jgi:hypothetical protein
MDRDAEVFGRHLPTQVTSTWCTKLEAEDQNDGAKSLPPTWLLRDAPGQFRTCFKTVG